MASMIDRYDHALAHFMKVREPLTWLILWGNMRDYEDFSLVLKLASLGMRLCF